MRILARAFRDAEALGRTEAAHRVASLINSGEMRARETTSSRLARRIGDSHSHDVIAAINEEDLAGDAA